VRQAMLGMQTTVAVMAASQPRGAYRAKAGEGVAVMRGM